MALTTQCPYCKTAFRVASDQLKLRDGLVRCGACQEIFDGRSHLLADPDLPPIVSADAASAAPPPDAANPRADALPAAHDAASDTPAAFPAPAGDATATPMAGPEAVQDADTPSAASADSDPVPSAANEVPTDSASDTYRPEGDAPTDDASEKENSGDTLGEPDITAASLLRAKAKLTPIAASAATEAAGLAPPARREAKARKPAVAEPDPEEPDFVTRARRTEKHGRVMHRLLWTGSALLFLILLMQAGYSLRNILAATYPQTRPFLQAYCKALGCQIELMKQIDAVAIEAIELQQSTVRKDTLILTSLLRNRSALAQAWPNIELSLNDANEKVIVRRVFTANDYLGQPQDAAKGFAANSEQALKLVFEVRDVKPAGYRVYLFYP